MVLDISARGHLLSLLGRQGGGDAKEVSRHHPDDATADQRPTVRDLRRRSQGGDHGPREGPASGEFAPMLR